MQTMQQTMQTTAHLDPFSLLGVTIDSTPDEVRRAYYGLCLVCHPDKGGEAADMACVHAAYMFVSEQANAVNRTETVESLEARFAAFCLAQTEEPPRFRDIVDCEEERELFHRGAAADVGELLMLTGGGGYGSLMVPSEYSGVDGECSGKYSGGRLEYRPLASPPAASAEEAEEEGFTSRPFARDVVVYAEPMAASALRGDAFSSSVDLIHGNANNDGYYSVQAPVAMADYVEAFNTVKEALEEEPSSKTLGDLLAERERQDREQRQPAAQLHA